MFSCGYAVKWMLRAEQMKRTLQVKPFFSCKDEIASSGAEAPLLAMTSIN
jgi:hypothetical protein